METCVVKDCEDGGVTEDGAGQDGDDEDREIKGLTGHTEKHINSCKKHFRASNSNNEVPENNFTNKKLLLNLRQPSTETSGQQS